MCRSRQSHALVLTIALIAVGCSSGPTLRVHEECTGTDSQGRLVTGWKGVPGVPFYKRVPRIRQETEYRREVITAEVWAVQGPDGNETTKQFLGAYAFEGTTATRTKLRAIADTSFPNPGAIKTELGTLPPLGQAVDPPMTANRLLIDSVIDPNPLYYINGVNPIAGVGKADFSFSADQTLTNAKAEVDDKTLSTVLSVLPIKEVLSKAFGVAAFNRPANEWGVVIELTTVTEIHKLRQPRSSAKDLQAPIKFDQRNMAGTEYEREFPKPETRPKS